MIPCSSSNASPHPAVVTSHSCAAIEVLQDQVSTSTAIGRGLQALARKMIEATAVIPDIDKLPIVDAGQFWYQQNINESLNSSINALSNFLSDAETLAGSGNPGLGSSANLQPTDSFLSGLKQQEDLREECRSIHQNLAKDSLDQTAHLQALNLASESTVHVLRQKTSQLIGAHRENIDKATSNISYWAKVLDAQPSISKSKVPPQFVNEFQDIIKTTLPQVD